jgi:hypothetical protein
VSPVLDEGFPTEASGVSAKRTPRANAKRLRSASSRARSRSVSLWDSGLRRYPIALRERPSPDATFYPARRRSAYNGAAAFRGKLPPKTCLGNPTASRHNGQSSPLGLLPPADFGGTPTPDPSVGKPLRVRQMPAEGDPPAAGCRHLLQDWLPPGSPVAYGGKPAPKLPQRGEPAQGTTLGSAGFTARRCSPHRSGT